MSTTPTRSVKVVVEVPESASPEQKAHAARGAEEGAVLSLWQDGVISTRQAAQELGLTYHDYLDLLAARGIPVESGVFDRAALEEARRKLANGRP